MLLCCLKVGTQVIGLQDIHFLFLYFWGMQSSVGLAVITFSFLTRSRVLRSMRWTLRTVVVLSPVLPPLGSDLPFSVKSFFP